MVKSKWKTPLTLTEHGITGLWLEYDLCVNINREWHLPFYPLRGSSAERALWQRASSEERSRAERRYEAAGSIIDLFKCDRISYREAVARIQELFS